MPVTVDATVSGASANSYVTLAEANTYFESRLNVDDWDGADDDFKNRALVQAAIRLDQVQFQGRRHVDTQRLQWPRNDVFDVDGFLVKHDVIPEQVKRAQMELALALLTDDEFQSDSGLEQFQSVSIGPISVTPRHDRATGALPAHVQREIAQFVLAGSGYNVKLIRG